MIYVTVIAADAIRVTLPIAFATRVASFHVRWRSAFTSRDLLSNVPAAFIAR